MSILKSTYSGKAAVPLTYSYFREHIKEQKEWKEIELTEHIAIFQYKGCVACLLYYDFNASKFYINVLFKKDYIYIKTIYQFELLINFYEAKDSKEIDKYLDLICQS